MIEHLNEIILHLSDLGLVSDPCMLPLDKLTTKEKLAQAIATLYSRMNLLDLRGVFLTAVQNIENFILSKQRTRNSPKEQLSAHPSDTFSRLYNHHFEKQKILDHKKKLTEVDVQCTFSPRINHDKFYRKVNSPFNDRNQHFMDKKKVTQAKAALFKKSVPEECTFKPHINNGAKQNQPREDHRLSFTRDEWISSCEDTVDCGIKNSSARKRAEQKSQQLKERLNRLLEDSQLPISIHRI